MASARDVSGGPQTVEMMSGFLPLLGGEGERFLQPNPVWFTAFFCSIFLTPCPLCFFSAFSCNIRVHPCPSVVNHFVRPRIFLPFGSPLFFSVFSCKISADPLILLT